MGAVDECRNDIRNPSVALVADSIEYIEGGLEPTRSAQYPRIEHTDVKCTVGRITTLWHGAGGRLGVPATLYGLGGFGNEGANGVQNGAVCEFICGMKRVCRDKFGV